MEQQSKTQKEQFINQLKVYKPEKYIFDFLSQTMPAARDLSSISKAKEVGNLPDPVINLLIHYVLLTTETTTLNPLFTDIATDWSSRGIKTVEEAIEISKQEHDQYKKWYEKYIKESSFASVMRGAIRCGMTDEQLGKYVKDLLAD
ncbi:DnaD domain protein (plasmid) [Bacillus cereus]|uniref:DnaD domain protein n=1 Tax=Bacillus TaxID=1386 RepID=UPI000D307C61|nr:DnaD domain protein [Bacillus cereus]MDF9530595.1 DnaD domain protein [Bacillus cereus]MDG1578869.1 DnaD domain protein [Bacillus cereus]